VDKPTAPSVLATLAPIDRDLLALASAQRVVTTGQLERLFPQVAVRTLRYRTARLVAAGLLGRTRPYRARGSAPSYFWPTRAADASVRGAVPAQGGSRNGPNPFFLAHAASITELYVGLATGGAPGLRLERFVREADAREAFRLEGRVRAIAPDARIELRDDADRLLLAHVEVDRGTMSIPRLKAKAAGYAAYWFAGPWSETYPFCPALIFLTTTEARARSVLAVLGDTAKRARHSYFHGTPQLSISACAMVDDQRRALTDACWQFFAQEGAFELGPCLAVARARVDQALATAAKQREAREERLARLRADPALLAEHLRGFEPTRVRERLAGFGGTGGQALRMLLEASGPPSVIEGEALAAVATYLGEHLLELDGDPGTKPAPEHEAQVARLANSYHARQLDLLEGLIARHGPLPSLLLARNQLRRGTLFSSVEERTIPDRAQREAELQRAQLQRYVDYLNERERRVREATGIVSRLFGRTGRVDANLDLVDLTFLRICRDCGETAFPGRDTAVEPLSPAQICPRCGGSSLQPPDGPASVADLATMHHPSP